MDPRARGRDGEERAAAWYRAAGYEVVARNWRAPEGEIDLVCRQGGVVIVCEVKARASARFGEPAEAVGPAKRRRLRRLAARWLSEQRLGASEVRFDVVTVTGTHLEVITGAF